MDEDNSRQGKGYVDGANDLISSGLNTYQKGKLAASVARFAATRAAALAVNPYVIAGIIVGAIIFLVIIALLSTTGIGELAPIGGGTGAGISANISSCQFSRAGQSSSYQSPLLFSYFQEAERLSGVPAALLASIARVETNPTNITDSTLSTIQTSCEQSLASNIQGTYRSEKGALGIMQIQPPGTTGSVPEGIAQGASYLGKTVNQINLCNPRENIIVSAGFILQKLAVGDQNGNNKIGDGKKWDSSWINDKNILETITNRYYGCVKYPSCSTGPYSYAEDIITSLSTCKQPVTPANAASCPIPNGTVTCGSKFTPINGCGHCGIGYEGHMTECTYTGINYAIDVGAATGAPVYLPQINGHNIKWDYVGQNITGGGAVQIYNGTDQVTQDKFYIEFHHTAPGSGAQGTHLSGDVGGTVCGSACNVEPHAHIELRGGNSFTDNYLDAALYFCRK